MTQDEATAVAREVVEARIQSVEIKRLELLNALRELEATIAVRKARAEVDIATTAQQLLS